MCRPKPKRMAHPVVEMISNAFVQQAQLCGPGGSDVLASPEVSRLAHLHWEISPAGSYGKPPVGREQVT
jgi:hypothetical protein